MVTALAYHLPSNGFMSGNILNCGDWLTGVPNGVGKIAWVSCTPACAGEEGVNRTGNLCLLYLIGKVTAKLLVGTSWAFFVSIFLDVPPHDGTFYLYP